MGDYHEPSVDFDFNSVCNSIDDPRAEIMEEMRRAGQPVTEPQAWAIWKMLQDRQVNHDSQDPLLPRIAEWLGSGYKTDNSVKVIHAKALLFIRHFGLFSRRWDIARDFRSISEVTGVSKWYLEDLNRAMKEAFNIAETDDVDECEPTRYGVVTVRVSA